MRPPEEGLFLAGFRNKTPSESQAYPKELAISEVQDIVQGVLFTTFASEHPEDRYRHYIGRDARMYWRGKLSVYPEKTDPSVTSDTIRGNCDIVSKELGISLWEAGFDVDFGYSNPEQLGFVHTYLMTTYKGYDIIIEPTIAQFIEGHNHVFVGTKDQLRHIIFNEVGEDKQFTRLRTKELRDHTDLAFNLVWGEKANRAPLKPHRFFSDVSKAKRASRPTVKSE